MRVMTVSAEYDDGERSDDIRAFIIYDLPNEGF